MIRSIVWECIWCSKTQKETSEEDNNHSIASLYPEGWIRKNYCSETCNKACSEAGVYATAASEIAYKEAYEKERHRWLNNNETQA